MNHVKSSAGALLRRVLRFTEKRPVYTILCIAPMLNLIVEILSHRSFAGAFRSIWSYPAFFVLNSMIVFLTLLPSLFVRRRYFARVLAAAVWLGLGITNLILKGYRTTPLSAADLKTLPSVWSIVGIYLKPWEIALILLAFAAVIAALVAAFRRLPKCQRPLRSAVAASVLGVGIFALTLFSGYRLQIMPSSFPNLAEAYRDYGFAWCFTLTAVDWGIAQPKEYSGQLVDEIVDDLEGNPALSPGEGEPVNVVFVQLESFFDPAHLEGVTCSGNPTRVFSLLKSACPSGYLTVPVVGAGTVNTEFEVLTGMSLDYFGTGEIPFDTVLRTQPCESLAYNLREQGYSAHAIHNNTATFYDRSVVYANLGFDSFTSIEYMNGVEYNALGWAKDRVLTGEILKTLCATREADFVYAVSVQPHGRYPRTVEEGTEYALTVSGAGSEELTAAYDYYINELRQTDEFIGELVEALSGFEEPTMLVLYGDHLPSLEIEPEMLDNGSVYQTEYVIWTNYGLRSYDRDLYAYQLSAHVMDLLGYDTGVFTRLHQAHAQGGDEAAYQQRLEVMEYDALYGERELYGGVEKYEPTDMRMGLTEVSVRAVEPRGEVAFVYGENFTPWSQLLLDGVRQETWFVDENTLLLTGKPAAGHIAVAQITDSGVELSRSAEFLWEGA